VLFSLAGGLLNDLPRQLIRVARSSWSSRHARSIAR
jgi:hypothetical protein